MKATLSTWTLTPARLLFVALLVHGGASPAESVASDWYVGIGAGLSRLTPDTNGSGLRLDNDRSSAIGVLAGWSLTERIALEAALTHLGNAELSDAATIDYSVVSGGAIAYWYGDANRVRHGNAPAAFARLGLSLVQNASELELAKEDNTAVRVALGIDLPLRGRWGARAEIGSFDGDAQAALLSLVWRPAGTGMRGQSIRSVLEDRSALPVEPRETARAPDERVLPENAMAEATATTARLNTLDPPASSDARPLSGSNDQLTELNDAFDTDLVSRSTECITPGNGEPVDAERCALFAGVLEDVTFQRASDRLTSRAESRLDQLVKSLREHPRAGIELHAHVARQSASSEADAALARARAIVVARYLVTQGIDVTRLRARSFGSTQPRLPGTSTAARAANERIEIVHFVPPS